MSSRKRKLVLAVLAFLPGLALAPVAYLVNRAPAAVDPTTASTDCAACDNLDSLVFEGFDTPALVDAAQPETQPWFPATTTHSTERPVGANSARRTNPKDEASHRPAPEAQFEDFGSRALAIQLPDLHLSHGTGDSSEGIPQPLRLASLGGAAWSAPPAGNRNRAGGSGGTHSDTRETTSSTGETQEEQPPATDQTTDSAGPSTEQLAENLEPSNAETTESEGNQETPPPAQQPPSVAVPEPTPLALLALGLLGIGLGFRPRKTA